MVHIISISTLASWYLLSEAKLTIVISCEIPAGANVHQQCHLDMGVKEKFKSVFLLDGQLSDHWKHAPIIFSFHFEDKDMKCHCRHLQGSIDILALIFLSLKLTLIIIWKELQGQKKAFSLTLPSVYNGMHGRVQSLVPSLIIICKGRVTSWPYFSSLWNMH